MELIKPDVQMKISSSLDNLREYIYERQRRIHEGFNLEMENYRRIDTRLGRLEERVANFLGEEYILTTDDAKLNSSSTILDLQAKYLQMEKVLEKLHPRKISSNIIKLRANVAEMRTDVTNIRSDVSKIRNSVTKMHNGETQMRKNIIMVWKAIENIRNGATGKLTREVPFEKVCEISNKKQEPSLNETFVAFDEQKSCRDVQQTDYRHSVPGNNRASSLNSAAEKYIKQILLIVRKKPSGSLAYGNVCVAVIINSHWAVTSAHCIDDEKASYQVVGQDANEKPFFITVKRVVHSYYNPNASDRYFDIGLLKSSSDFKKKKTHPTVACLPTSEMRDKLFGPAIFLSWGDSRRVEATFRSLRQHKVCLISDEECRTFHKSLPPLKFGSVFCTQADQSATKACVDSEGGLLFKEVQNKAVLIGIAWNCGSPDKPIVYTKVPYHANWMRFFPRDVKYSKQTLLFYRYKTFSKDNFK